MKKNNFFKKILTLTLTLFMLISSSNLYLIRTAAASEIAAYQQAFINAIAPTAMKIGKEYRLFPSVMIAQAILESDWGRSKLAMAPYYNLFGIKSFDGTSGVVFDTQEDDGNGNFYWIKDSFRKYNSMAESMYDYAKLFTSTPFLERHYADFLNAGTVQEATQALTGTYATATNYGSSLMAIIVAYNLLKYDANIGRGPSWSIKTTNDVVYVTHDEVNVRQGHSTDDKILGRVHTNYKLLRIGTYTGWSKIRLDDGNEVFIATQYLSSEPKPFEKIVEGNISLSLISGGKINSIKKPDQEDSIDKENNEEPLPTEEVQPAAPEPENIPAEPESMYTEKEVEAAKDQADAAIANQSNSPTEAPKSGVLDARTVGSGTKSNVDKRKLENLLGSNINLPFVSEELKKTYARKLGQARAMYYKEGSTQAEIDKIVKELNELSSKADDESVNGKVKDLQEERIIEDELNDVKVNYTKNALRFDKLELETKKTRKPKLRKSSLSSLRQMGEKYVEYNLKLKTELKNEAPLLDSVIIRLPIPEDLDMSRLAVYRFADDFTLHEIAFKLDEAKREVIVEEKHMGRYIIIEKNKELKEVMNDKEVFADSGTDNKDSYPISNLNFVWIFIALTIVASRLIFVLRRRGLK